MMINFTRGGKAVLVLLLVAGGIVFGYCLKPVSRSFSCHGFVRYEIDAMFNRAVFNVTQNILIKRRGQGEFVIAGTVDYEGQTYKLNRSVMFNDSGGSVKSHHNFEMTKTYKSDIDTTPDAIFNALVAEVFTSGKIANIKLIKLNDKAWLFKSPLANTFVCNRE